MLAGTREGSVAVLWNNFVSHTGCSYLSLCFGISKPTRMCLVHPVLTEQKTFKEGEKPRVLLLIPPTPLLLLPHQLWSPHSPSCPSLSNAGTRQVNIHLSGKSARLTILKGFLGQQRKNYPHRKLTKASLSHLWCSTRAEHSFCEVNNKAEGFCFSRSERGCQPLEALTILTMRWTQIRINCSLAIAQE